MNFRTALFIFAILATFASAPGVGGRNDQGRARSTDIPDRDRGPAFSSPKEGLDENGDMAGHYPPYYYTPGGGQ